MKKILVTGAAGFIGFHLCNRLLTNTYNVIGLDNFTLNYPVSIKKRRVKFLQKTSRFTFFETDIREKTQIKKIFETYTPESVVHLAALTGVRPSIKNPIIYMQVNVQGTKNVYEIAQQMNVKRFIFSSSSSVYGNSVTIPFQEQQALDPQSPYAESKNKAEQILHKLHMDKPTIYTTILRFFSVYGPDGRPDMAPYLFTQAAFKQKTIAKFGSGKSARDYTFIDDVINAIIRTLHLKEKLITVNIGNSSPITLNYLIQTVEKYTGRKIKAIANKSISAEAKVTYADISRANTLLNWQPKTPFLIGMQNFINWYKVNVL